MLPRPFQAQLSDLLVFWSEIFFFFLMKSYLVAGFRDTFGILARRRLKLTWQRAMRRDHLWHTWTHGVGLPTFMCHTLLPQDFMFIFGFVVQPLQDH